MADLVPAVPEVLELLAGIADLAMVLWVVASLGLVMRLIQRLT